MKANHEHQTEPIHSLTRPGDAPLVRSTEDLRQRWRSIFGTGGFIRSLWLMGLTADGRQLPVIIPIDNLPRRLWPPGLIQIGELLSLMVSDDATVAMALTCPWAPGHRDGFSRDDRRLAADIQSGVESARAQGAWPWRTWPLHMARDGVVEAVEESRPAAA